MASIYVTVIHKGSEERLNADNRESVEDFLLTNGYPTTGVSITVDDNRMTSDGLKTSCLVDGSVIVITSSKQASGCYRYAV